MLQHKSLLRFEWKAAGPPGSFRAVFATLGVVDSDKDVTIAGAFTMGQPVVVSAYMHSSWYDRLPVGRGVIGADEKEAWVDGQFIMDTTDGKDTYLTVKALAELQEWSYGYEPLEVSYDPADLEAYPGAERLIKKQGVFEISPVLKGAGVGTRTESLKSARRAILAPAAAKARAVVARLKALQPDANTLATIAQVDLLVDQADELVDTLMDQFGIPDPDEELEGEPEEPKSFSFVDHAAHAQAGVKAFVTRAKSLADLRAKKQHKEGRVLSTANRERLAALATSLNESLADIGALLAATDPDADKSAGHRPEMLKAHLQLLRSQSLSVPAV
jgi:hypothetical protein